MSFRCCIKILMSRSVLLAIVAFMVWGFSPMLAVFWATVVTFAVSFLRRDTAMGWRKVVLALRDGSSQMLNVAATCAAAGIIVGVVTLTGLGLKFSNQHDCVGGAGRALAVLLSG